MIVFCSGVIDTFCSNVVVLFFFKQKTAYEIDQKSVAAAIEGVGRDLLDNLPALSKGQVIVAGAGVNTPVICRVRERYTKHGGESKDAPDIWRKHFSSEAQESRKRGEAPLHSNKGFNLMR